MLPPHSPPPPIILVLQGIGLAALIVFGLGSAWVIGLFAGAILVGVGVGVGVGARDGPSVSSLVPYERGVYTHSVIVV